MDDRKTFLLEMYNQMFADINRHIMVVWQSIGVIGGAIALLALAEKRLTCPSFCTTANERVYITAKGCETVLGGG